MQTSKFFELKTTSGAAPSFLLCGPSLLGEKKLYYRLPIVKNCEKSGTFKIF